MGRRSVFGRALGAERLVMMMVVVAATTAAATADLCERHPVVVEKGAGTKNEDEDGDSDCDADGEVGGLATGYGDLSLGDRVAKLGQVCRRLMSS